MRVKHVALSLCHDKVGPESTEVSPDNRSFSLFWHLEWNAFLRYVGSGDTLSTPPRGDNMMTNISELLPLTASNNDNMASSPSCHHGTLTFTETQVDQYREQDRYLPVRADIQTSYADSDGSDGDVVCECIEDHETLFT